MNDQEPKPLRWPLAFVFAALLVVSLAGCYYYPEDYAHPGYYSGHPQADRYGHPQYDRYGHPPGHYKQGKYKQPKYPKYKYKKHKH